MTTFFNLTIVPLQAGLAKQMKLRLDLAHRLEPGKSELMIKMDAFGCSDFTALVFGVTGFPCAFLSPGRGLAAVFLRNI